MQRSPSGIQPPAVSFRADREHIMVSRRMLALFDARYFNVAGITAIPLMSPQQYGCKRNDTYSKFTSIYAKVTDMGKQDRKLRTLEILVKSDLALTPQVLFMNLKLSGATFERRSVGTYLNEMQADGYVEEIDINNRFTLYRATERGREWFEEQTSISGYRDSQGGVKN